MSDAKITLTTTSGEDIDITQLFYDMERGLDLAHGLVSEYLYQQTNGEEALEFLEPLEVRVNELLRDSGIMQARREKFRNA